MLDSVLTKIPTLPLGTPYSSDQLTVKKIIINSVFCLQHSRKSVKNVASTNREWNKVIKYIKETIVIYFHFRNE